MGKPLPAGYNIEEGSAHEMAHHFSYGRRSNANIFNRLKYLDAEEFGFDHHVVVAHGSKVVGVAVLSEHPEHEHLYGLKGVSVDPAHQGKGIASALVEKAKAIAAERGQTLAATSFTPDGFKKIAPLLERAAPKAAMHSKLGHLALLAAIGASAAASLVTRSGSASAAEKPPTTPLPGWFVQKANGTRYWRRSNAR